MNNTFKQKPIQVNMQRFFTDIIDMLLIGAEAKGLEVELEYED